MIKNKNQVPSWVTGVTRRRIVISNERSRRLANLGRWLAHILAPGKRLCAAADSRLIHALSTRGFYRPLQVLARMPLPGLSESSRFQLVDACFQRADFEKACFLSEGITEDKRLARKARLTREWIRFHQGDYTMGWPTYPGVMDFTPGSFLERHDKESVERDPSPVFVTRATHPDALEEKLGLRPWDEHTETTGPLLVWFNFNSSIGGEILCGRLVRSFQKKIGLPIILAVDNRHKGLFEATFTDWQVIGKDDDMRAIPTTCRHYILARDMARHVIASDEDFVPIAAETMSLPPAEKTPDLPGAPDLPRIAISWKTTNTDQGRYRNIPLHKFAALLAKHSATYYAAQHGDISEDKAVLQKYLGDRIQFGLFHAAGDSHEMGQFLSRMDAVITIDNSLLHLCGALGVKTFALLSIPAYWAFPKTGTWARWYASVNIIRQDRPGGHWKHVLDSLDSALNQFLKTPPEPLE